MTCTGRMLRLGRCVVDARMQHPAGLWFSRRYRSECRSTHRLRYPPGSLHTAVASGLSTSAADSQAQQEHGTALHIPVLLSEILQAFQPVHLKV